VGRDTLPCGGRPPRLGRGVEPWEARDAIRLEPRAHGGLVAVESPGNLRDTPALRIQEDVVTALGELWPGTTGLFSQGVFFRRQDKTDHGDPSPAGEYA
jgi:hypothetical protein